MTTETPTPEEPETRLIRYVYSDVVGYTRGRSVEAQSHIIDALNTITLASLNEVKVAEDQRILLPTGDGICVAVTAPSLPYDIHLQLALALLRNLKKYNSFCTQASRRFGIRIGLNENVDNLITDVNGRPNVAGAGIVNAQRAMDQADENQILLGSSVVNILQHREKYQRMFRKYDNAIHKGGKFLVHQFIADGAEGLNVDVPKSLAPATPKAIALTKLAAYYLALSITHEAFLMSLRNANTFSYVSKLWLYLQAKDLVDRSETGKFDTWKPHTWRLNDAHPLEQFTYYDQIDFWVRCEMADFVVTKLIAYHACFEDDDFVFVSELGRKRLIAEQPEIAKELSIATLDVAPKPQN